MKILVVDDSATMRRIIIMSLKQLGISDEDITQANNGSEAVDMTGANTYDLILMDWNMPVMTGIDALTMMRSLNVTTPVIMVTTESEKDRILEAIKKGANNYIAKPFRPEKLILKIQQTLHLPEVSA